MVRQLLSHRVSHGQEGGGMSDDLVPISLDDEIICVRREIGMRERVYPRWVAGGKMKQHNAEREIAVMKSVLESLYRLKGLEK